jgi:hypothetical protein
MNHVRVNHVGPNLFDDLGEPDASQRVRHAASQLQANDGNFGGSQFLLKGSRRQHRNDRDIMTAGLLPQCQEN